jgi:hypothetical protein
MKINGYGLFGVLTLPEIRDIMRDIGGYEKTSQLKRNFHEQGRVDNSQQSKFSIFNE